MMVSALIPDRTGNFAMIAVEPVAHMGLRPIDMPRERGFEALGDMQAFEHVFIEGKPHDARWAETLGLVTFWPS